MHRYRSKPGFTLIELLVSIGIIALLIALAIPSFAHVRRSSKRAVSLSSNRQIMQMLSMYTQANRDTHPYIVSGQLDGLSQWHNEPLGPNQGLSPGTQSNHWANLLTDDYPGLVDLIYPNIAFWPEMRERRAQEGIWRGVILATNTIFAAPGYFSDTQPVQESQLRATRTNEIAYPSAKMIFYDWSSVWLNSQRDIEDMSEESSLIEIYSFADGSAAAIKHKDFNAHFVERSFASRIGTGFTTVDGLAGRDR